jgi:hypothetical protein
MQVHPVGVCTSTFMIVLVYLIDLITYKIEALSLFQGLNLILLSPGNTEINFSFPKEVHNFLISFSRKTLLQQNYYKLFIYHRGLKEHTTYKTHTGSSTHVIVNMGFVFLYIFPCELQ